MNIPTNTPHHACPPGMSLIGQKFILQKQTQAPNYLETKEQHGDFKKKHSIQSVSENLCGNRLRVNVECKNYYIFPLIDSKEHVHTF